jgi:hypothetical protein
MRPIIVSAVQKWPRDRGLDSGSDDFRKATHIGIEALAIRGADRPINPERMQFLGIIRAAPQHRSAAFA